MTLGDFSSSLQPFHWEFNYVSFGGVRNEATLANAIDLELNWTLFAVASGTGTYGNINGGRIGSFSITRNGAKIIDFRPVRVGTDATSWEGAMMDVLTRHIYRNAGTGAFTYGNDLKYPIPAE